MKKHLIRLLIISIATLSAFAGKAQKIGQFHIDSLLTVYSHAKQDTDKVKLLLDIGAYYGFHNLVESKQYISRALQLAKNINWAKGTILANLDMGIYMPRSNQANLKYLQLKAYRDAYDLAKKNNLTFLKFEAFQYLGEVNIDLKHYSEAESELKASLQYFEKNHNFIKLLNALNDLQQLYDVQQRLINGQFVQNKVKIYLKDGQTDNARTGLVQLMYYYEAKLDYDNALNCAFRAAKYYNYTITTEPFYFQLLVFTGDLYKEKHDYANALTNYQKAAAIIPHTRIQKRNLETSAVNMYMGNCYYVIADYETAYQYHLKAGTAFYTTSILTSLATDCIQLGKYDQASGYLKQFIAWNKQNQDTYDEKWVARLFARIYYLQGKYQLALTTAKLALAKPAFTGYELKYDDENVSDLSLLMGHLYTQARRYQLAVTYFNRAVALSIKNDYGSQKKEAYEGLAKVYGLLNDYRRQYDAYHHFILLKDSILDQDKQKAFRVRVASFAAKKQADSLRYQRQLTYTITKAKKIQQYYFITGIILLLTVSFFIASNYINQRKSNKIISAEKKRSDDLLLNILPSDVAEELKEKGSANARLFDEVTVLFTDFVSFTTVSEVLTPQQLVDELNVCFKAFDGIMGTHNIEKIKTIGDAYLAVSGLPHAHKNHAVNTIKAAQEIQQFMIARKKLMGDKTFGIRIGIHSGSVVAGIVGIKKFAYDIWGDTVNTAARMEQNSQAGKINISEKTYELVSDQFTFEYRGEIAAKNKGMLKMYFVENNV
jgi:adenylate cyclase